MNTSKTTFIAVIFTLFFSGHLFSGLIEGITSTDELDADFYIAYLILFFIGLISFRQFLWLINGRQEMIIENGTLTLSKKGTFLTKQKTYSLDRVENIRHAINEDDLSQADKVKNYLRINQRLIFGHIFGQILFDYNGQTIKVFSDLNKYERAELIGEMTKRIK